MKKKTAVKRARVVRPSVFPAHLQTTAEAWRNKKRQEWRELMFALDRYNYGSAFVPAQAELWRLQECAKNIKRAIEADGWVSW